MARARVRATLTVEVMVTLPAGVTDLAELKAVIDEDLNIEVEPVDGGALDGEEVELWGVTVDKVEVVVE